MPTLEQNSLIFRFPQTEKDAKIAINFQRTLRIPDTDQTYSLPPGLGSFPLRHVEDFDGLGQFDAGNLDGELTCAGIARSAHRQLG